MNIFKNFSIRKLLSNKKISIALSIIFAFVFWLIIAIDQSPERDRTLDNLKIVVDTDSIFADSNLRPVGEITQTASVTVYGPNYIVSSLKADDIKVRADISAFSSAGVATVNLTPVRNSDESGYSFVSISPAQISIKLDYYESKEFMAVPVVKDVNRVTDSDYRYETLFAYDSSTELPFEISGFREDLNEISRVEVVASSDKDKVISETVNFDNANIVLYDRDGRELDTSKFELPGGNHTLQVRVLKVKTLPVKPTYLNLWNPEILNVLNSRWTVDVESLTLIGPPDAIDSLNALSFKNPIDITNLSPKHEKNVFDLIPELPDGVEILDGVDSVQFSFDMTDFVVKRLKVTNISHEGTLSTNFEPIYPKFVYVEVCGTADVLDELKSDDYYLAVDLSAYSESVTETVPATFKTYKRKPVWQVVPCSVDITIR